MNVSNGDQANFKTLFCLFQLLRYGIFFCNGKLKRILCCQNIKISFRSSGNKILLLGKILSFCLGYLVVGLT